MSCLGKRAIDLDPIRARQAAAIQEAYGRARSSYGSSIGRQWQDIATPALLLDLAALRRNIARMSDQIAAAPADLRPHIKVHKSPEIAKMQLAAGAIGVSTATVWEAVVMARSGVDQVLIVNTLAGRAKMRTVAHLAKDSTVLVAVDSSSQADALSSAAAEANSSVGILIEVNTGMDRAGVDTPGEARELARHISRLAGVTLNGLTGYEGHCALTRDHEQRVQRQRAAMQVLLQVAAVLRDDGFPSEVISAGGTATWKYTAWTPGITEIQAGSYALMDEFHRSMAPEFDQALFVGTTVISRRQGRAVLDAGSKSLATTELARLRSPEGELLRFDEEHAICAASGTDALPLGASIQLVPGYAPSTVNLYDVYHVMENDTIVDIWPILARGPGHGGLNA